jgi:hypothetical protein
VTKVETALLVMLVIVLAVFQKRQFGWMIKQDEFNKKINKLVFEKELCEMKKNTKTTTVGKTREGIK